MCFFSVWSSFPKSSVDLLPPSLPCSPPDLGWGCWCLLRLDTLRSPYRTRTRVWLLMTPSHCPCLSFHYFGCYEHFTFHFLAVDLIFIFYSSHVCYLNCKKDYEDGKFYKHWCGCHDYLSHFAGTVQVFHFICLAFTQTTFFFCMQVWKKSAQETSISLKMCVCAAPWYSSGSFFLPNQTVCAHYMPWERQVKAVLYFCLNWQDLKSWQSGLSMIEWSRLLWLTGRCRYLPWSCQHYKVWN